MAKTNDNSNDSGGNGLLDRVKNLLTNKVGIALVGALAAALVVIYMVVF